MSRDNEMKALLEQTRFSINDRLQKILLGFVAVGIIGFIIFTGAFRTRFVVFSNFLLTAEVGKYEIFGSSISPFTLTGIEIRVPPKRPLIIGVFLTTKSAVLKGDTSISISNFFAGRSTVP